MKKEKKSFSEERRYPQRQVGSIHHQTTAKKDMILGVTKRIAAFGNDECKVKCASEKGMVAENHQKGRDEILAYGRQLQDLGIELLSQLKVIG